jgi:hypothetical protein
VTDTPHDRDQPKSNVVTLQGIPKTPGGTPNQTLIESLETVLMHARAGRLQSFIGTGFTEDGLRLTLWDDGEALDVYSMLGALTWLQHEYANRHESPLR